MKIVAITVTFNRTQTLKRTIESLLAQTTPVDKIVVVDNNSKSEEKEILNQIAKSHPEQIDVVYLKENTGGAGGFEAGMAYARNNYAPEWYWIMDDDAYPRRDCLEQLLKYKNLDKVGCLCPVAYGIDLNNYQYYHHKLVGEDLIKDIPLTNDYHSLKEINRIDANAFVGPLISYRAVEKVGIANGQLFIYGDDTEYTYRVRQYFNNYLIKSAIIDHQDPPKSGDATLPKHWWKEYYSLRNRFLFIQEFGKSKKQIRISTRRMSASCLKAALAALIRGKYRGHRILRLQILLFAMIDGIKGKQGKVIDPVQYNKSLEKKKRIL